MVEPPTQLCPTVTAANKYYVKSKIINLPLESERTWQSKVPPTSARINKVKLGQWYTCITTASV